MASDSTVQPSSDSQRNVDWLHDKQVQSWAIVITLCVVIMLTYFNSLARVAATWSSAQYSHGYLVPLFSIVLLWLRREPFTDFPAWHRWVGVGLIAAGTIARVITTKYVMFTVENLTLIPCLMGAFVVVGGLRTLRSTKPVSFTGPSVMVFVSGAVLGVATFLQPAAAVPAEEENKVP